MTGTRAGVVISYNTARLGDGMFLQVGATKVGLADYIDDTEYPA